jgi:predicted CopG family antitoxin
MAKKSVKTDKNRKTITIRKDVWKKLSMRKTQEDHDNFSDLIEKLLNQK